MHALSTSQDISENLSGLLPQQDKAATIAPFSLPVAPQPNADLTAKSFELNTAPGTSTLMQSYSNFAAPIDDHFLTIETRVGETTWSDEIGQKIVLLINKETHFAQIKLNPAELGRIEVRINMAQDQAEIRFAITNSDTREAIEAALPRLKEMLADNGITLGGTSIGDEHFHDGEASPSSRREKTSTSGPTLISAPAQSITSAGPGNRLVDTFA